MGDLGYTVNSRTMETQRLNAVGVEAQLSRILNSSQFRSSPRLQTFLRFVVSLTLAGRAEEIKESTIAAEVFGREGSSDDSIVRSAARRLRVRLEEYYRQSDPGDSVVIELPVGTYVPVFSDPPKLIAPIPLESLPNVAPLTSQKRNWGWVYAAVFGVCAFAACLGIWLMHRSPAIPTASRSPAHSAVLPHVVNPIAHDLLIKGRFDLQQVNADAVKRAEADFQHAIDLDPDYAQAYVDLAKAKLAEGSARGSIYRTELERDSAEELSRKALQLDPNLPDAHAVLANLAMQYDWDWSKAEREFQLALAGPPSAKAELGYAFFLIVHRRFSEADQHLRRAQDLEPFDTINLLNLNQDRYLEGRFDQASEVSQRLLSMHPTFLPARVDLAGSYIWDGHPDLALVALARIKTPFPALPFYEAMAQARAGRPAEALRLIRPYEERYPNTGAALQWIAKVYAMLGDEPNTMKWLSRSADRREWQVLTIAVNPAFALVQDSQDFRALKKRMGLQ